MFTNYFKIAWRNLTRNRVYSTINILGLALGMAIVLLIGAWIHEEVNFNTSIPNYSRIAYVMHNSTHSGHTATLGAQPIPLAGHLKTRYGADFKRIALCTYMDDHILQTGTGQPVTNTGIHAETALADIFSLQMIAGSRNLDDPGAMLISRSLARTLYGDADPLNKMVKVDNKASVKITGVYEDIPGNVDWKGMNFMLSWNYLLANEPGVKGDETQWNSNGYTIMAELQPGVDADRESAKIRGALEHHARKDKPEVLLFPMTRWHLYGDFKDGKNTGGDITYVWMFGSIGLFVLLLACINFMNLSTARSEKRAREVGIRKSVGSLRGQLVLQFLGESVLLAALAAVLAVTLAKMALPWFSELAGVPIHLTLSGRFWGLFAGLTLAVGIIAGSYPALYLSSFNAVKVLKGTFKHSPGAAIPRKALTILQFTVSTALIIGTMVVFQQIVYVKNRPVGYEREGLLTVRMNTDDLAKHATAIRDELKQSGAVTEVTEATSRTTNGPWQQSGFNWEGKDPSMVPSFDIVFATPEYGRTVGWQVVQGRDFSRDFATDSAAIVINEAAVKYMGLKKPVGAMVNYLYSSRKDNRYRVVGVVKDMVMSSPRSLVHPAIFMTDSGSASWMLVKVNPAMSMSAAIPRVTAVFKKYNPSAPFDYQFSSEAYAQKFQTEDRVLKLAVFFTVFAIFISCLGLFGLASFMAEQRVREIGVRKVLGASVSQLWGLLSKEFVRLVVISFLIAAPLAWFGMNKWLQGYDYRTTIDGWVFLDVLVLAIGITLATVSWQAIRTAMANPVRALRSE
ncbi:ABC transporter permease [Puia sp.]|uniref:ABC transporter permease n=1 Tax=Puia sp. TaxID=2045100 RepID=UPI002F407B4A